MRVRVSTSMPVFTDLGFLYREGEEFELEYDHEFDPERTEIIDDTPCKPKLDKEYKDKYKDLLIAKFEEDGVDATDEDIEEILDDPTVVGKVIGKPVIKKKLDVKKSEKIAV